MPHRYCLATILTVAALVSTVDATSTYPPPPNIPITQQFALQNEEQAWICPVDSNVVVANWRDFILGYRQIGVGRSVDGGQSWSYHLIPDYDQFFGLSARQSDPTLTVDRFGNYYMTALDYNPMWVDSSSTISVYVSQDKGDTWSGPFPAVIPFSDNFEDKQFTTVDRTGGPYDGNFYMAWARFPGNDPNRIMFVRSTDGGQTFDPAIVLGPNQSSTGCGSTVYGAGQFANVLVESDGDLHALWVGITLDSGMTCSPSWYLKQRTSTDGGQTFGPERNLLPVSYWWNTRGGIAVYSQPAADADITGGPFDGNLYISFTNRGPEDSYGDVDFIRSTDGGQTWSARRAINDDGNPLVENFHPWLHVNQEGVIIVIFYDQRLNAPTYESFDLFAAYSFDGGETFTSNHRITTVSSSPYNLRMPVTSEKWNWVDLDGDDPIPTEANPNAGLLGEYIAVSAYYDKVSAVWTDSRDGNSDVYTANWYLPRLEPRLQAPDSGGFVDGSPTLRWATSWKHDQDRYRYEISDDPGFATILYSGAVDTNFADLAGLTDGLYFWRVKALDVAGSDSSGYSDTWRFWVDATAPVSPTLLSPAEGATVVGIPILFDWVDVTRAATPVVYDFYLSDDPAFTTPVFSVSDVDQSTYEMTMTLIDSTDYYWYVVARDGVGNQTSSDTAMFTFVEPCCVGVTGNVDADPEEVVDISDLTALVNTLFVTFEPLACPAEADVTNGTGEVVDISDLTALVNTLFVTFEPLASCAQK